MLDVLPAEQRRTDLYRVHALLERLSFRPEQWRLGLDALSGGEQNLALLARALVADPDLLLMDEPGNHMDVVALAHLQRFFSATGPCPFLLISHDRELLDSTCNRTVFLRDKTLYSFDLPYEKARAALADHDAQAWHQRQAEAREIKRLQASATRVAEWESSTITKILDVKPKPCRNALSACRRTDVRQQRQRARLAVGLRDPQSRVDARVGEPAGVYPGSAASTGRGQISAYQARRPRCLVGERGWQIDHAQPGLRRVRDAAQRHPLQSERPARLLRSGAGGSLLSPLGASTGCAAVSTVTTNALLRCYCKPGWRMSTSPSRSMRSVVVSVHV